MIASLEQDRCQRVARSLANGSARETVATALLEIALEGLEFGPRDLPLAEDRDWIRGHVSSPLQEATDAAFRTLVSSLSQELERAPRGLLDRFERSHDLEDLGIE